MKEKEPQKFSWPWLFIVTSFCFIAFAGLIKLINGSPDHSYLFLIIGIIAFVLSGLSYVGSMVVKESPED
jgi:hypothetical protein